MEPTLTAPLMAPWLTILIIVVLLLISAVFCATEIALLSSSKAQLHQAARKGPPSTQRRALVALNLLKQPDQVLAAILIVMTIIPVASSAMATNLLVSLFGPVGMAYATLALGLTILLLAEALPKALGTKYPESITLALATPMSLIVKVLSPATWAIKMFNTGMLRLIGLGGDSGPSFTEADLRGAINLGLEAGALGLVQHRMLDAVLDLDTMTVADVMIHRSAIVGLDIATAATTLPKMLGQLKHSRVIVYQDRPENPIGILNVRDYLTALAEVKSRADISLKELLRPLYFVPETTPLGHQLLEFLKHHRHLALVVDEYGDLQGLITLEDILEEIVGEIADEHDPVEDAPHADASGSITLRGNLPVRTANRDYGWDLPTTSAVTLAGLMIEQLGHLPSQGQSHLITTSSGTLTLTVATKRGHKIEKIRITPSTKATANG
jgi:Mg2+/Co2+ transporter CorB